MLCRVEMPTNEAIFARFYRWKLLRQGGLMPKLVLLGLPLLIALFTGYLYYLGAGIVVGLVMLAVALGYSLFTLYLQPGMQFRKKEGVALQTEVYIFTEKSFTRSVRSEEGGLPDNMSAQYDLLVRAVETKHDFYLFYAPTQAYLVDKAYFTKGGPDTLRAILTMELGDKFK